jgi:amino acid transporter
MSHAGGSAGSSPAPGGKDPIQPKKDSKRDSLVRAAQVIIISSVMFTFISYWRTAAVVLCDLASTAYYIGGAVEAAIGPSAPWFILAVMLFSYAVRSVYIESCSLFVRGGVYRVVKEAMGGFLAKLSVSALMFDYVLTGPTSGVSAGQYIMGLLFQTLKLTTPSLYTDLGLDNNELRRWWVNSGAVLIACLITLYFFRQNLLGIHESSDKALKIMIATSVMAAIILTWCVVTLVVKGPINDVPIRPDLNPKFEPKVKKTANTATGKQDEVTDPATGKPVIEIDPQTGRPVLVPKNSEALGKVGIEVQEDPLGLLGRFLPDGLVRELRNPASWLSIFALVGLVIAFGHSILAMSGEETLAQVYREVESPKLPNFRKAAFIVFIYSLVFTAGISFMAVALIPDDVRMTDFSANLIGGLARHVIGPDTLKLFLEGFVVIVGFLILAGAVNTAIIGSNGVLNRVAEDGVLPDWFLKPHPRYGTTYRVLYLIAGLQLAVIIFSGGDMILLTEAYAFGVVWSFVFKALAMVVLRFKDRSPREFKVPLNIKIGNVEVPIGLSAIFLVLLVTALLNLFTKEVATVGGVGFTIAFLTVFMLSEHYHEKRRVGARHEHLEQFNQQVAEEITPAGLGLAKPYRKLVAIRSPQNLFMLEQTLVETDPETTDVVVMTAKVAPPMDASIPQANLDRYDQGLMTAVVERAEKAGKKIRPMIVPTNNPLHAVLSTAKALRVQEVVVGASNKFTAEEQLDQIAFYWISLHDGMPHPLTVRILSRSRDVYFDLEGGNRIPRISEVKARTVAELRAAGVGVDRVLLVHDGTPVSSDIFQSILTMLDPQVVLDLIAPRPGKLLVGGPARNANGKNVSRQLDSKDTIHVDPIVYDQERAEHLGRTLHTHVMSGDWGEAVVRTAREGKYDMIIIPLPASAPENQQSWIEHIRGNARCQVALVSLPTIPQQVDE